MINLGMDVDFIYAAMLGERPWSDFLTQLKGETPAGKATLQLYDYQRPGKSFVAQQAGFDDTALRAYGTHYAQFNLLQQSLALKPDGIAFADDMLVSRERRTKSSFFNEWLLPNEVKASVGVKIARNGAQAVSLVLLGDAADDTWRRSMSTRLTALAPHLQRAGDFYKRRAQRRRDVCAADLGNAIDTEFMVIGRDARIEFMSSKVARLLEDQSTPLHCNHSRLHVSDSYLAVVMSQMNDMHYAGPKTVDHYLPGLRISLIRPEQDSMDMLFSGASMIIMLRGRGRERQFDRKLIAKTYNLTPAEMRALDGLVAGKSAAEIAQEARRSHETIRVQIRSLYAKLGAHSAVDVIRLVNAH